MATFCRPHVLLCRRFDRVATILDDPATFPVCTTRENPLSVSLFRFWAANILKFMDFFNISKTSFNIKNPAISCENQEIWLYFM
jgi:hypothetical protein